MSKEKDRKSKNWKKIQPEMVRTGGNPLTFAIEKKLEKVKESSKSIPCSETNQK